MKKSKIGCLCRLDVIFFDVYGAFTDKQPAILSPQASSEAPTRAELREPLCFIFFLILDPRFAILEITSRKFDNPPRPTHHDHILVYKWLHYASLTPRRLAHFLLQTDSYAHQTAPRAHKNAPADRQIFVTVQP